jgi:hypothetical protein
VTIYMSVYVCFGYYNYHCFLCRQNYRNFLCFLLLSSLSWLCSLLDLPRVTVFTLVAKVTNIRVVTFTTMFIKVPEVHFLLWLSKRPPCFALLINCSFLHCIIVTKKVTSKPLHTTILKSCKTLNKIAKFSIILPLFS